MTHRRLAGLALLGGAAAALGHAPFGFTAFALAGFAGLIWAVSRTDTARRAAFAAWAGGLGYFAVALHWIVEPFLVDVARHGWMAPFALVLLAGGLALFWGLASYAARRYAGHGAAGVLGFAALLALAELARGYVLSGFPWALPAYVWAGLPAAQAAAWVGPYGLTAITLLLAALPALDPKRWRGGAALVAGAALLLTLPVPTATGETLGTVRLVQPNAPQDEKWDPDRAHIFVQRQVDFTAAPKGDVDLVVWPETALPYRLDVATPVLQRIGGAAEGLPVVLGINRSEAGRNFNALVTLGPTGVPEDVYDKVRLVPFGEFIPFGQVARLAGIRSFAARDGYGFSRGAGVRSLETPLGRALPLICYEAIFPQHIRALDARPDYLLQITNDAWFGTFSGPFQHLDQARFRAIEQGLPLVRVANTGVSAVIAPDGRVMAELGLGEAGFLDVAVPRGGAVTLYARTGDLPSTVALLLMLAVSVAAARRKAIAKPPATG